MKRNNAPWMATPNRNGCFNCAYNEHICKQKIASLFNCSSWLPLNAENIIACKNCEYQAKQYSDDMTYCTHSSSLSRSNYFVEPFVLFPHRHGPLPTWCPLLTHKEQDLLMAARGENHILIDYCSRCSDYKAVRIENRCPTCQHGLTQVQVAKDTLPICKRCSERDFQPGQTRMCAHRDVIGKEFDRQLPIESLATGGKPPEWCPINKRREIVQATLRKTKCSKCNDTGVIETGNNDLPCSCPAGNEAVFNVAGVGTVKGKNLK